jgi:dephospho-CoA kinase
MLIVGLTGSIGMGKSTAAARFRHRGIAVFDADAKVHELYNGRLAAAIEAAFPGTAATGKVDREALSQALLKSPQQFKTLEAIVHPAVRTAERAFLLAEAAKGASVAVLEVPLLFEAGGFQQVDCIVVASAPGEVQRQRVLDRPGMTAEKLDRLLSRQLDDAQKRSRADFVVDTAGSVANCNAQIDAIVGKLQSLKGRALEQFWRAP